MNDPLSLPRLYALRACYLLLVVGLGLTVWPGILHRTHPWELMNGVVKCVLAAVSLLALLGLRYPVRMLPLLLFEMVWKSLWLLLVAAPQWSANSMDADTWDTAFACLLGVVFPLVIPWPYVIRRYLTAPGDRWWGRGVSGPAVLDAKLYDL